MPCSAFSYLQNKEHFIFLSFALNLFGQCFKSFFWSLIFSACLITLRNSILVEGKNINDQTSFLFSDHIPKEAEAFENFSKLRDCIGKRQRHSETNLSLPYSLQVAVIWNVGCVIRPIQSESQHNKLDKNSTYQKVPSSPFYYVTENQNDLAVTFGHSYFSVVGHLLTILGNSYLIYTSVPCSSHPPLLWQKGKMYKIAFTN